MSKYKRTAYLCRHGKDWVIIPSGGYKEYISSTYNDAKELASFMKMRLMRMKAWDTKEK
jgi:hypothetical protein